MKVKRKQKDGISNVPLTLVVGAFFIVFLIIASAINTSSASDSTSDIEISSLRSSSASPPSPSSSTQHILLKTNHGNIQIKLLPGLSPESVQHIRDLAQGKCQKCQFYRSEKDLLLQGIMKNDALPHRPQKGPCPQEFAGTKQDCPKYDANCACHGPTMTKGMVGWAGGGTGPDFFINVFEDPVDWWGQQHTVWGIVVEEASLHLIVDHILALPVKVDGGMRLLKESFDFQMELQ